jgi:polysaccharide export outer membrane protein
MKRNYLLIIPYVLCILVLLSGSCTSTRNVAYFYNATDTTLATSNESPEMLIQRNDILSIFITSLSAEASSIFNTTNNFSINSTTATGSTASAAGGYLVNIDGYIQLPILGNVRAAGLTKKQLKDNLTNSILEKKLLLDPIVNIRHLNYEVTVIGEVAHPTVITVPSERISLVKALGLAGDLTIYGKRDNVLLIREEEGKRRIRRINLGASNFLLSPYYYLKPNDVVYVEPNKAKVASASRTQMLIPTFLSGLSIIVTLIYLVTLN